MDEHLVGYLLEALEPEVAEDVERSLASQPELRARLDVLQRALAPLAADADDPAPPPALVLSTLARIAEHQCRKLEPAPPPPREQVGSSGWRWARRPDVLVAAVLLILLSGMGASTLVHWWRDYYLREACANNLREVSAGLQRYCTTHNGNFPRVEEKGPHAVAGIFVPILNDAGMLSSEVSLACPAEGSASPKVRSVHELEMLYARRPEEFALEARKLAGSYAYSLGYRDGGGLQGLRCDSGDNLPIMADRLVRLEDASSRNHGGTGQNVLYLGGSVRWCTQRTVGIDGDDIYVNRRNEVHAGLAREDTVLGASDASPGQD